MKGKEADHSRLVADRFNNTLLFFKAHLEWSQDKRISTPGARVLKVYTEALPGFSLNCILLSQGHILENGFHCGKGGRNTHYKDRKGGTSESIGSYVLSMTSSNIAKNNSNNKLGI